MGIDTFAGVFAANNRYAYCGQINFQNALRRGNTHTGVLWLSAFFSFLNQIINFKYTIMLETRFTKGEWVVRNEETTHIYQSTIETQEGVRIAELKSFGNDTQFKDSTFDERLFNEKLICAAPDMFNALLDLYDDREVWSDLFESQQEFICRVLNKATDSDFFQH